MRPLARLWGIVGLVATWLTFEAVISWAAFCQNQQNQTGRADAHEEYYCVLKGPVASLIRGFIRLWAHVFHDADAYVALFTAILAVSTIALWRSTKDLWEAGERQLRTTRAVAAVQARNARRQLKLSEETAERQLRAYICVVTSHIRSFEVGKTPQIHIVCKNSGQTPAYDVVGWSAVGIGAFPATYALPIGPPAGALIPSAITGPNGEIHLTPTLNGPLTERQLGDLAGGKYAIFAYGEVRYCDAFGRQRRTRFYVYYGGQYGLSQTGALAHMDHGNYAD